jgi:H+/Cl- antiporter ClcA
VGPFVTHAAGYGVAALVLLFACKAIAYAVSMSAFRGGPIFPAILVGAVGGAALSHLPGLPLVAAVGMGIAAMTAGMLRLPMTAVLLSALLLSSDSAAVTPLAIVAVVTCYVAVNWLDPAPAPTKPEGGAAAPPAADGPASGP